MPKGTETFTERFNRLTSRLETHELIGILRVDGKIVARLKSGQQQMLKLDQGLRLARHLQISPYELLGEHDPAATPLATAAETESRSLEEAVSHLTRSMRQLQEKVADLERERQESAPRRRARAG